MIPLFRTVLIGWLLLLTMAPWAYGQAGFDYRYEPAPVVVAPVEFLHHAPVVDEAITEQPVETVQGQWLPASRGPVHQTIESPLRRSVESLAGEQTGGNLVLAPSQNHNYGYNRQPPQGQRAGYDSAGQRVSLPHPVAAHGIVPHGAAGVQNDPGSIGPGRLGMGEHWIKVKPQARPAIPGAQTQPTWKTPYSYGYFGAPGKRHWSRQTGYRDRYLQWTLR